MTSEPLTRGMWVWNTSSVIASSSETAKLVAGAQAAGVTDLYLYVAPSWYALKRAALQVFIAAATVGNLRVWGLDGDRAYFACASGPADFYAGIGNLIAYNRGVPADQRFCGFQADNEPQDSGEYKTFHNEIPDTALSRRPGSGVWQSSQARDREMLLRSWLVMHQEARRLLHAEGLRFGVAMPFWTEDYYGAEVQVSFPGDADIRQGVMKYMMTLVDDYVVMSFNTDPLNAAARVQMQASYASKLPAAWQPRVYGSVETTAGVGTNVSYGDTPGKNARKVVLEDLERITGILRRCPAFKGMAIEQWSGWEVLPG
ncbi:hypothetical protein BX600DRAFT_468064 [Xylariales sp. PMI_506]|nr:hypothetical protein BX600DRAFT_468064 [Xylariales sp. PMI_506]